MLLPPASSPAQAFMLAALSRSWCWKIPSRCMSVLSYQGFCSFDAHQGDQDCVQTSIWFAGTMYTSLLCQEKVEGKSPRAECNRCIDFLSLQAAQSEDSEVPSSQRASSSAWLFLATARGKLGWQSDFIEKKRHKGLIYFASNSALRPSQMFWVSWWK